MNKIIKSFAVVLCIAIVLSLSVTAFAQTNHFSVVSTADMIKVGETLTMTVTLEPTCLSSMGVELYFDSDVFEIVSGDRKSVV